MMPERRFAVALLAVVSSTGCGMMHRAMQGEPVWMRHRVSRAFDQPSHRILLATYEVLRGELSSLAVSDVELTQDDRFNSPDGKMPMPGELKIPSDVPAFWMSGLSSRPLIVNLRFCDLRGNDRQGRQVEAVVRIDFDDPKKSIVSLQVGHQGDDAAGRVLLDKIAERVAHPTHRFGSPEERDALSAVLGPESSPPEPRTEPDGKIWRIRKK